MPKYFGRLAAILFLLAALICFLTALAGSPEERATRMIVGSVIGILAGTILFFATRVGSVKKEEQNVATFNQPIQKDTQTWTEA